MEIRSTTIRAETSSALSSCEIVRDRTMEEAQIPMDVVLVSASATVRRRRLLRPSRRLRLLCYACLAGMIAAPLTWWLSTKTGKPRKPRPLRVLFVGNSFTYGPPPYDRANQRELNSLPRMFKLVSESLGRPVLVAEDTIGGCTLHVHRPSANPEACPTGGGAPRCKPVRNVRVGPAAACTVDPSVNISSDTYHPCPQLLMRQPLGAWDAVVVQDYSALPTVRAARDAYLLPAVAEFASALAHSGGGLLLSYSTWAYLDGSSTGQDGNGPCPRGSKHGCFPLGTLRALTPNCTAYDEQTHTVACMTYALARGYAETLSAGADVLVPAGLAWLTARGAPPIPEGCRASIDEEYPDGAGVLAHLPLPLRASTPSDARWSDDVAAQRLFRDKGPTYRSRFCGAGCHVDHHASAISTYLNALVFYATLFGETPAGAAWPDGRQVVDGMRLPAVDADEAGSMQRIAADVVLPHMHVWWKNASAQMKVVQMKHARRRATSTDTGSIGDNQEAG